MAMQRSAAFFCMPDRGHFQRVRPLISGLTRLGLHALVYSHTRFKPEITALGGTFINLFSHGSIDDADDESWPLPCRFVTFAAQHTDRICKDLNSRNAAVILHDTFAVIGAAAARTLKLPQVNICAGHAVVPKRFLSIMQNLPIVRLSDRCRTAAHTLQTRHNLPNASPFSYLSAFSDQLNIYCEPPAFLPKDDRPAFHPVAFYGSLPDENEDEDEDEAHLTTQHPNPNPLSDPPANPFAKALPNTLRIYISFGTVIWDYRRNEALAALTSIANAIEQRPNTHAVISLGGNSITPQQAAALTKHNVSVETYVDQWNTLQSADLFITHHGLNSTHEAVYHKTPMLSYPFVWDQPTQAQLCQQLGIAAPLIEQSPPPAPPMSPMSPITPQQVTRAIDHIQLNRPAFIAALETARQHELNTIADRPNVLQRILDLCA